MELATARCRAIYPPMAGERPQTLLPDSAEHFDRGPVSLAAGNSTKSADRSAPAAAVARLPLAGSLDRSAGIRLLLPFDRRFCFARRLADDGNGEHPIIPEPPSV